MVVFNLAKVEVDCAKPGLTLSDAVKLSRDSDSTLLRH